MKLRQLLFALLITGCTYLPQANVSSGQSVVVKTRIADSNLTTKTVVNPYTSASINHLLLQFMYMPSQTIISSVDIPGSQLNLPIKLTNLAANRSYRIKATAYKASGTSVSDVISTDDALSRLDFATSNDDQPSIVTLPVKLIDKDFNGIGTSSIAVTNGGYNFAASESIAFLPPLVTTFAGTNQSGNIIGTLTEARFNSPSKIVIDGNGTLYVTDTGNSRIKKIAGSTVNELGGAAFTSPRGIALYTLSNTLVVSALNTIKSLNTFSGAVGENESLAVSGTPYDIQASLDTLTGCSTMLYPQGTTIRGSEPTAGASDWDSQAIFNTPRGILTQGDHLYVADTGNNRVVKLSGLTQWITAPDIGGAGLPFVVETIYGNGTAGTADGSASTARFNAPCGLAMDSHGNLYVSDTGNHRIRCIDPSGNVTTYAGPTGAATSGFTDGVGTTARFNSPDGLAVDASNNLFVVDTGNHCIRYLKRIY